MAEKRESEENAKRWKEVKEEAEKGDTAAMYDLAMSYQYGELGLEVDNEEAYKWYKKGADVGNLYCRVLVGDCLLTGRGTEANESEGLVLVSLAAEKGSDYACFLLGERYYKGLCRIRKDNEKAKFWLEKAIGDDCNYKHLNDQGKEKARVWLQAIAAAQEVENHDGDE